MIFQLITNLDHIVLVLLNSSHYVQTPPIVTLVKLEKKARYTQRERERHFALWCAENPNNFLF